MRFVKTLKSSDEEIDDSGDLEECLRSYSVKLAYLFGSHSHGKATEFSDVDIAVLFEEVSDKEMEKLRTELMELLGEEAIDLIDLEKASPRLKYHIVKEGRILIGEGDSTKFEVKTMQEYFDFKPLEERYFDEMKERIESGTFGR